MKAADVVPAFLAACPSIGSTWQEHLKSWDGEKSNAAICWSSLARSHYSNVVWLKGTKTPRNWRSLASSRTSRTSHRTVHSDRGCSTSGSDRVRGLLGMSCVRSGGRSRLPRRLGCWSRMPLSPLQRPTQAKSSIQRFGALRSLLTVTQDRRVASVGVAVPNCRILMSPVECRPRRTTTS
jgi:hypothetical protein